MIVNGWMCVFVQLVQSIDLLSRYFSSTLFRISLIVGSLIITFMLSDSLLSIESNSLKGECGVFTT